MRILLEIEGTWAAWKYFRVEFPDQPYRKNGIIYNILDASHKSMLLVFYIVVGLLAQDQLWESDLIMKSRLTIVPFSFILDSQH